VIPSTPYTQRYGIILVREEIDRFRHNALFANELSVAMREEGVTLRTYDYISQSKEVFKSLIDPNCIFVACLNGFGSELLYPHSLSPNGNASPYTTLQKPLLDWMHDCPAHDTMRHQVHSTFPERRLLLTDHGYVAIAKSMGMANAQFMPSITFPAALPASRTPLNKRSIPILLPVGMSSPESVVDRFIQSKTYKARLYTFLFDAVTEGALQNWAIDPVDELDKAAREAGVALNFREPDARFLLSAIVDYVKFSRRRRLLAAISHLPVTVLSDHSADQLQVKGEVTIRAACSANEMLQLMSDSQSVVCPTPHFTGFHERVLGAFTAGAAVISSPNAIMESTFVSNEEYVRFGDEPGLVQQLEALCADPASFQAMANAGQSRAMNLFSPTRVAKLFLSALNAKAASA
jgi:Glycosyl transferases group 1